MVSYSSDVVANYFKIYTKVHNTAYHFLILLDNQGKLNDIEEAQKKLRKSIKEYKEKLPVELRIILGRNTFCGKKLSDLEELIEHYQAKIIACQVF